MSTNVNSSNLEEDVKYLRSLPSIRERCTYLLNLSLKDNSLPHFQVNLDRIPDVVELVEQTMKENYPGGVDTVPFHSRLFCTQFLCTVE